MPWSIFWLCREAGPLLTEQDLPTLGLLGLAITIGVITIAGIITRMTQPVHKSPTGRRPRPVKAKVPKGLRRRKKQKPRPRLHDKKTPRPKRR